MSAPDSNPELSGPPEVSAGPPSLPAEGVPLSESVSVPSVSNVSVSATSNTSVTKSGIPGLKPSGIKPPSKIGRPCSGNTKPQLPVRETKNSPESDLGRNDYRRQKLTDVEEEVDENYVDTVDKCASPSPRKTRNYSVSSNMSMDTLWDIHPRRLSEAGLRRHSDTSVVLTEDTDAFIIGMRVWVGGTKPGQIAYLGETQFAPGEWAGVVLDEPIGKNDGSVAGTRYFQCEPKKGVFSRLTRLTLSPLPEAESPSSIPGTPTVPSTPRGLGAATPNGSRRALSPTGSVRSVRSTAMSVASSVAATSPLKLGTRVIVSSSQGSKPGTLRFNGPVYFAKGTWCGVELDEPLGKNDGCVEGRRYFTCPPKYGLFAPLGKVTRSPSAGMRKPCVVHRAGSRESLGSIASGVGSMAGSTLGMQRRVRMGVGSVKSPPKNVTPLSRTPMQDVLREKEHHIEQLMREREIDRSEISRAAAIADKAENDLLSLQQDYEKYRLENELKLKEQSSMIQDLEKQKLEILSQLEDEKKKLEDATFRFEEESLTKDDIEAANQSNLTKIQQLEDSLKKERMKNEKLEQETRRLFETEEILAKIQEEMENLQKTQDNTTKNIAAKDEEIINLKQKLEEQNICLLQEQQKLKDKTKDIEVIIEENNILLKQKEDSLKKLNEELIAANKLLKEKHIGNEITLLKELKKIEMDLSAKTFDCENSSEKIKDLEKKISLLQEELNSVKNQDGDNEKENRWKNNIEDIRQILRNTVSELLRVRKDYAIQLLEKDISLREKDIKLTYELMEIQKLKQDFTQTISELNQNSKSCRERYAKQIEMRNIQIEDLLNNLQTKSKEIIGRNLFSSKLEFENSQNNIFISKLKCELDILSKKHEEQTNYLQKVLEELKITKLQCLELNRKNQNSEKMILDLKQTKLDYEQQLKTIIEASNNDQLKIINEELKKTEYQLDNLKLEMIKKLDHSFQTEQELRYNLQTLQQSHQTEKTHLQNLLQSSQNSEAIYKEKLQNLTTDSIKIQEQLQQQILELSRNLERSELEYKKQIEVNLDKIKELEQILEMAVAEHQQVSSELSRRIEELTQERDNLKISVKKKTELLIEAQENAKDYASNLDTTHEKQLSSLKNDLEMQKNQIEDHLKTIEVKNEEINNLKKEQQNLEQKLKEETLKFVQINEEKTKIIEENSQMKISIQQNEENLKLLTQKIEDISQEKTKFEKLLNEHQKQIQILNEEIKNLQSSNSNIQNTILEKDTHLSSISEEIKQLQTLKNNLESSNTEKDNKISVLSSQLEEIMKEKGSTSETFAAQEKKIMDLNMNLQKIAQEKSSINNELNDRNNDISLLKETLTKKEEEFLQNLRTRDEEILQLKQKIEEILKEKDNISKNMSDSELNMSSLTTEIENLKSVKTKLEEIGKENEEKLLQLTTNLQNVSSENTEKLEKLQLLEKTLQDKETQISSLQTDLQILKQNWEDPKDHPIVKDFTSKLEESKKKITEKEAELSNLNDRLQAISKAKGTDSEIISAQEEQILSLKQEIQKLNEEKTNLNCNVKQNEENILKMKQDFENSNIQLNNLIKEKDTNISSLKQDLEQLKQNLQQSSNTIEDKVQSITKLSLQVEDLNKQKHDLEIAIKQIEENFNKLKEEMFNSNNNTSLQTSKILELETSLQEKQKHITDLQTNLNNLQKQWNEPSNHPLFKEISSKLEETNKNLQEKENQLSSVSSQLETNENQNKQLQKTFVQFMNMWKNVLQNLGNNKMESVEEQMKKMGKEEVKSVKFEEFSKKIQTDSKEFQHILENIQKILEHRDKEINNYKTVTQDLQNELTQVKLQLSEAVKLKQTSGIPKKTKESQDCDLESFKKMQEEKEFAIGQVEFLNSIIVDMQQKNEELQTKIQILENGVYGVSPTETNIANISRVIPPRQYCDICEMFDLHETEDCPIQQGDDDQSLASRNPGASKNLPEPRPYCEICEEFGHNTENCDADETY